TESIARRPTNLTGKLRAEGSFRGRPGVNCLATSRRRRSAQGPVREDGQERGKRGAEGERHPQGVREGCSCRVQEEAAGIVVLELGRGAGGGGQRVEGGVPGLRRDAGQTSVAEPAPVEHRRQTPEQSD